MVAKGYTRVKKGNITLLRFVGFKEINDIVKILQEEDICGRIEIEYVLYEEQKSIIYALYFLNERHSIVGRVFPHGYMGKH